MLLVLTGCVSVDKATGKPIGFIWNTNRKRLWLKLSSNFATDQGLGFWCRYHHRNHYRALDYLATWYLPIMEGNASL